MNRQVLPSMVLSVLIVCFFAVVLFPLEHDRAPSDESPGPPVSVQSEAPAPRDVVEVGPLEQPRADVPPAPGPDPEPSPSVPITVRQTIEAAPAVVVASPPEEAPAPAEHISAPSAAPSESSTIPEPPAPLVPAVPQVDEPALAPVAPKLVVKAAPSVERPKEAPTVDVAEQAEEKREKAAEPGPREQSSASRVVSIPRSDPEVTIVDSGETLDDVAIRVYGSRSGVETLLRANREVLTRRNGPLRAGLQLWTPGR